MAGRRRLNRNSLGAEDESDQNQWRKGLAPPEKLATEGAWLADWARSGEKRKLELRGTWTGGKSAKGTGSNAKRLLAGKWDGMRYANSPARIGLKRAWTTERGGGRMEEKAGVRRGGRRWGGGVCQASCTQAGGPSARVELTEPQWGRTRETGGPQAGREGEG